MVYTEIQFELNENYLKLTNLYELIENDIIDSKTDICQHEYMFNNHIGDITRNIKWTWAINYKAFNLFENFIHSYKHLIEDKFNSEFFLRGCSFITLYEKEVNDSEFHLDITSNYDIQNTTNTLTIIFPLYIDDSMGGLEYKDGDVIKIYKYSKNKMFIWDACKLEHRTQPYKLLTKKNRVLISLSLSTDKEWAIKSVENTLKYQGNICVQPL